LLAQLNKPGGQQGAGQQGGNQNNAAGGGNQGAGQQAAGAGSSNQFPGITWPRDVWGDLTSIHDSEKRKSSPLNTLCYVLLATTGSLTTPPFVLRPVAFFDGYNNPDAPCIVPPDDGHPILMRGRLVVAIDARRVPIDRMRSMNVNVTTTQGSALSTNPLRSSLSSSSPASSGTGGGAGGGLIENKTPAHTPIWGLVYYLIWPQELQGDAIPTVTVNIVYTPPVPGTPWQQNTVYPEGSVVTPEPSSANGRYYTARIGGISGNGPPCFQSVSDMKDKFTDGTVIWIDSGPTAPSGAPAQPTGQTSQTPIQNWQPGHRYDFGNTIFYPPLNRYYMATTPGISGTAQVPGFAVKTYADGPNLIWVDSGATNPGAAGQAPAQWQPNHPYTAGQVIYEATASRYYTVSIPGTSSDTPNKPRFAPATIMDLNLVWTDLGTAVPAVAQLPIPTWTAQTPYRVGDVIFDPARGHYFTSIQAGTSDVIPPITLKANQQVLVPDAAPTRTASALPVNEQMKVGQNNITVTWNDLGPSTSGPAKKACSGVIKPWESKHPYQTNSCILANSGHYFQLDTMGSKDAISGDVSPAFPPGLPDPPVQSLLPIQWEDSGFAVPSLVSSGQPADQTATLTYTVPQVHSKYYFNLSSGVVVSSIRSRTFGWNTLKQPSGSGMTAVPGQYYPIQTGSNLIVDPVLFFSAYIWPMDAERTWQKKDLRPALTFGLSLTSPSSNFYVGGSSEFVRNVQLAYGFALAQTSRLAPGVTVSTSNTTAPGTVQTFSKGVYVGLSFNISGFLQTLFGGAGKGSQ
jgi:hypothetical protein